MKNRHKVVNFEDPKLFLVDSDRQRHVLSIPFHFINFWNDTFLQNWVKGHGNIVQGHVTYFLQNLIFTKGVIWACNFHHLNTKFAYMWWKLTWLWPFLPKGWYFNLKMSIFCGFCPDHMISRIGLKSGVYSLLIRTYKHSKFDQNRKT